MTKFSDKIKSLFKSRKLNVFILFFILAFGILILSKLTEEYTSTAKFKVNLKNIPDETVVLNDSLNALNLTLTASGFKWLNYSFNEPEVTIDFNSEVRKMDSVYVWSYANGFAGILEQFSKDIKIESITPDTLSFKFDVNAIKYVPVKSNLRINFTHGYNALEQVKITPDSVKVIGPETLLNKLKSIKTEALVLDEVNKPFNKNLVLLLDSINPEINVKTKTVEISVAVEKFTEGTLNIPVSLVNVPRNMKLNYFPKSINVSYYTSLSHFNSISIEDFIIECDYSKLNRDNDYLTAKLVKKPDNVKSTRLHQQKIEFIIVE